MLSEHVVMDSFGSMLREADHAVSSPHGRVSLHVFWELIYDFIPNFIYNSTTDRLGVWLDCEGVWLECEGVWFRESGVV